MFLGHWLLRSTIGSFLLIFVILPACFFALAILLAFVLPWIEGAFAFGIIGYVLSMVLRITVGPLLGWPLPPPRQPPAYPAPRMSHYEVHEDDNGRFRVIPIFPRR
jgi:hypothetical protein